LTFVFTECDEKEATFDVEIDQYISTLKDVKSSPSKFVTPFSCSIPDSPQYKTGKPVLYNRQYISISGFLTDVTYKPDSDVMQRFHLKVENIVFLGQQCNVMGMIPNSFDSAFFFFRIIVLQNFDHLLFSTFKNTSHWKGTDRLQVQGASQSHNSNSSPRAT